MNNRFRTSVLDTRVFRSVYHQSDHELVVSSLRFKIKAKRCHPRVPCRMMLIPSGMLSSQPFMKQTKPCPYFQGDQMVIRSQMNCIICPGNREIFGCAFTVISQRVWNMNINNYDDCPKLLLRKLVMLGGVFRQLKLRNVPEYLNNLVMVVLWLRSSDFQRDTFNCKRWY